MLGAWPVKLVATDLDGTLLDPRKRVPEENYDALEEAVAQGVRLVVATGRPRRLLGSIDQLVDLRPVVIASNGAMVYELGAEESTRLRPIDPEAGLAAAAELRALAPGVAFGVEHGDTWGREAGYPASPVPTSRIAPLERLFEDGPVIKLLALREGTGSTALYEAFGGERLTSLTPTFGMIDDSGLVELSAPGVSKGSALLELMADWGIDASEAAAFGDMPNDLEMLRLVGHPHAMAGSHPWVLEEGFPVVASVGRAVRRLLAGRAD